MNIAPFTRIIKTKTDFENGTYTIFNNTNNNVAVLDSFSYNFIKTVCNRKGEMKIPWLIKFKSTKFIADMISLGFITNENINENNIFLNVDDRLSQPLTHLSIELTDFCNLKCVHCYGGYGRIQNSRFFNYQDYKIIKKDFSYLNVFSVALTGGECTLNNDFEDIALDILNSGLKLTILTNASYNFSRMKNFLERTRKFKFSIKVSLDGTRDVHNKIRGNENSYDFVIKFLDELKKYKNVAVSISTVLMKLNKFNILDLKQFILEKYPNFKHTTDIILPCNDVKSNNLHFSIEELINLKIDFPELFINNDKKNEINSRLRCSGGVQQATISPDGSMKICNAASDSIFKFEHNVLEHGLAFSWINCGKNIEFFREERNKSRMCSSCSKYKLCTSTNCRLLAHYYLGNHKENSPLTCIKEKGSFYETDI